MNAVDNALRTYLVTNNLPTTLPLETLVRSDSLRPMQRKVLKAWMVGGKVAADKVIEEENERLDDMRARMRR